MFRETYIMSLKISIHCSAAPSNCDICSCTFLPPTEQCLVLVMGVTISAVHQAVNTLELLTANLSIDV